MVSVGLPFIEKLRARVVKQAVVKQAKEGESEKTPKEHGRKGLPRWFWPLGVVTTGVAGAAVVLLRGCWHRKMSWPIRVEGYSYQVCLGCGIKRLFDENTFHGFGSYSYDLHDLIARDRAARMKALREETKMSSAG